MSFKGIRKSIHSMRTPTSRSASPTHRLDEFPAGYSSTGCSPAEPASASPATTQYADDHPRRSTPLFRAASFLTTNLRPLSFDLSHRWGALQDLTQRRNDELTHCPNCSPESEDSSPGEDFTARDTRAFPRACSRVGSSS